MKKRNYTPEFKLKILKLVASGKKRRYQVLEEYDIPQSTYGRWHKDYVERGEAAFTCKQPENKGESVVVTKEITTDNSSIKINLAISIDLPALVGQRQK